MIVTKEHQEALVNKYVKEKHNTDECIGFIDGLNSGLELVKNLTIPSVSQQRELLIAFTEDWNLNNCDDQTHITDEDIEDYLAIDCG